MGDGAGLSFLLISQECYYCINGGEVALHFAVSYQKLLFILKIRVAHGNTVNDICIHNDSLHACKHLMTLLYLLMWSCWLIYIFQYILSLILILKILNVFQNYRVINNIYEIGFRIVKKH